VYGVMQAQTYQPAFATTQTALGALCINPDP
jgi:hypothetical protein